MPPDALAQQHSHRRKQYRRALDREAGIGEPEAVDPVDLGEQAGDLPEGEQDADGEHAEDQCVQPGIGEERGPDLLVEHGQDEPAQNQEHQHPDEENPGRGQLKWIDVLRHGLGSEPPNSPHNKARTRRKEEPADVSRAKQ